MYDLEYYKKLCEEQGEEIELLNREKDQLNREKEWLIENMYNFLCKAPIRYDTYKKTIENRMQQALKEG